MTDYHSRRYGGSYDGYVEGSTMNRMEQQYWQTKQTVFRKLGKKEDECIIASDSELDSKLELFQAIKGTCSTLMRVLELYQDKICILCQEENALGRFLKDCGKQDKTRAGKMMTATGKTLSFTAQKGIELRAPLVRLYQEVETFQIRAIADTAITVEKMEKSRNAYRGSLMWMKDISQQLDPDMNKQLEKFRKVQGHVRRSKTRFDKLKVDTLQKVDLLSASRCNMFSHALVSYQNTLLQFWEKTSRTMSSVAESFKGYQHYEFNMLKELTEPSKKLAEETSCSPQLALDEEDDKDKLIFFDAEYHDEDDDVDNSSEKKGKSDSLQNLYDSPVRQSSSPSNMQPVEKINADLVNTLLDLEDGESQTEKKNLTAVQSTKTRSGAKSDSKWQADLLTNNPEIDDSEKDNMTLLNEILGTTDSSGNTFLQQGSFAHQWHAAFGDKSHPAESAAAMLVGAAVNGSPVGNGASSSSSYLPSHLLSTALTGLKLSSPSQLGPTATVQANSIQAPGNAASKSPTVPMKSIPSKKKAKNDMSAWFNLFADLDPLSDPDAVGKSTSDKNKDEDRSC